MWHQFPENEIEVQLKSNPGQTTSSQCGNRGYSELATIPMGTGDATADHGPHLLQADTRRAANGALALTVSADGRQLRKLRLSAAQSSGLEGPIGVRSDNGDYLLQLSGKR
jgi:hypothetical protein